MMFCFVALYTLNQRGFRKSQFVIIPVKRHGCFNHLGSNMQEWFLKVKLQALCNHQNPVVIYGYIKFGFVGDKYT